MSDCIRAQDTFFQNRWKCSLDGKLVSDEDCGNCSQYLPKEVRKNE
jgi:hypothetical protein